MSVTTSEIKNSKYMDLLDLLALSVL